MKKLLKEEFVKFVFGLLATAIGVFVALSVNNWNNNLDKEEQFKNMLKAIHEESNVNFAILTESFSENVNNNVIDIKSEFTYEISEEFLKSEIFLNKATDDQVKLLSYYILNLKKANTFKIVDHNYKEEKRYLKMDEELKKFREIFNSTLKIVREKILEVDKIKFQED